MTKLVENGRVADIASMQDMLDAAQGLDSFRAQQAVRVRNYANSHAYSPLYRT
jgi:hypothetical protein